MIVYVFKNHTYISIISPKSYSNFQYLTIHQAEFKCQHLQHLQVQITSELRSDDPKKLSLFFVPSFP